MTYIWYNKLISTVCGNLGRFLFSTEHYITGLCRHDKKKKYAAAYDLYV